MHRLFEEAFNAGDLDALMELYEPDAALIAQPGSVAHGGEQARAALQGFLASRAASRWPPSWWSLLASWPTSSIAGRCAAPARTAARWSWGHDGRCGPVPGRRQLAICDRQRLGRPGGHRIAADGRRIIEVIRCLRSELGAG
jgi:SnoaL-like protein